MPPAGTEIVFENVDFSYVDGEPVLEGASFTIPAGKLTAIVGDSGAGKSTVLNLIAKYYRPQGGRVTIGGQDIREVPAEQVLSYISLVDQDVFLFNDTVRSNIRYARPGATDREVEDAAVWPTATALFGVWSGAMIRRSEKTAAVCPAGNASGSAWRGRF